MKKEKRMELQKRIFDSYRRANVVEKSAIQYNFTSWRFYFTALLNYKIVSKKQYKNLLDYNSRMAREQEQICQAIKIKGKAKERI